MQNVRLEEACGNLVGYIAIRDWAMLPQVIIWNNRCFEWGDGELKDALVTYRENWTPMVADKVYPTLEDADKAV